MKAAICAIGSELLGADRVDTNSLAITRLLRHYGVPVVAKACVGDELEELSAVAGALAARADLVITTGGLGPTADDRTREAVALLLDRPLGFSRELLEGIAAKYRRMQRPMPEVNRRQAEIIEGSIPLRNDWGTAPGVMVEDGETTWFLLPGVPREMERMVSEHLRPWLEERLGGAAVGPEIQVRVACVPESAAEERLTEVYERYGTERVTVLAKPADLRVRVRLGEGDLAEVQVALDLLRAALDDTVYSVTGDLDRAAEEALAARSGHAAPPASQRAGDLEEVVVEQLVSAGQTVAVAESCTGGLVGERLTAVPGSSAAFVGGGITYSNELKRELLDVPTELLEQHGAVSEPVARAMAEGARRRFASDWALAITGIAGPGGAVDGKPVGTVHLAVAGSGKTWHQRHLFPGERARVRWQAAQTVLDLLRRRLGELPESTSWWQRHDAPSSEVQQGTSL